VLYSCGANHRHGIRRSNEDKRRAVIKLLEDAEWKTCSSNEIAKRWAVHHSFVEKVRAATCAVASETAPEPMPEPERT
jgi:hypothetical protein